MNADSTFQIGKDHTVCEDYALAGVDEGLAYAIVCDGCSASNDVDFGARVMAFSAQRIIKLFPKINSKHFGDETIVNANRIFNIFPQLNPQALDATLLIAWVNNKTLTAYLYGDGVLIHKNKVRTYSMHVSLSSGAPDYLSYHLDEARMAAYKKLEDNTKEIEEVFPDQTWTTLPHTPMTIQIPVEEGDIVAVVSDGINSFRKSDNTPIAWKELIDEFAGFKTTEGQFVVRRLSAFKRKCFKEGITHSDDISIASIVV
jgi:hypothetical protein